MKNPGLLTLLILLAGCASSPPPRPEAPIDDGSTCASACGHVGELQAAALMGGEDASGCAVASRTKRGRACTEVCENAQTNGVDFHVSCLTHARSCPEAHDCGRSRR